MLHSPGAEDSVPSDTLFRAGIARLPPFTGLRVEGKAIISVLALAAVYLQNLDLVDDAYYYVGDPDQSRYLSGKWLIANNEGQHSFANMHLPPITSGR